MGAFHALVRELPVARRVFHERPTRFHDTANARKAFLGGIARNNKMKAMKVNGVEDHVHILLSLPATLEIAKAVQLPKGNSSKWIHETFPDQQSFEWQKGYGAFSIGVSGIEDTIAYIENQREHHTRVTFQDELASILRKHGIEFDLGMLD
jgi:putative transposase